MTKTQKITYYALTAILTALFLFSAFPKLTADPQAVQGFAVAGLPLWFCYTIGTLELLGAIGLWVPKTSRMAAGGLLLIVVAATIVTAAFVSFVMALFPLVVAVVICIQGWLGAKRASAPASPAAPQPAA